MKHFVLRIPLAALLLAAAAAAASSGTLPLRQVFTLTGAKIRCTVTLADGHIIAEKITLPGGGGARPSAADPGVETDGGFSLDLMWSDWRPPGKKNNAENPVVLTARDFTFVRGEDSPNGKTLSLYFTGPDGALELRVSYALGAGGFFVRRNVSVMDTAETGHLLRSLRAVDCLVRGNAGVVKAGGFGQPAALRYGSVSGAFFGLEYPASQNDVTREGKELRVRCGEEVGEKIGRSWCEGSWAVTGVTPDTCVKKWFWKYLDDIRVAPLRPYTLYNSWYDLRSPDFRKIPPGNVMNEENIMRIIGLLKVNMVQKHGIALDAFVLDDGWDLYASDWVLRSEQFPRGLKPIADELRKTGTDLGLWLGPTGGYSFHPQRMAWMKAHGYEVVDDQLCLAGTNYSALFRKRVVDFVRDEGVAFFKWDGIQFVCNEPDHGHPVDIYSRRAVLASVIDKCNAVRGVNPRTYLNITSGTWLSPWWLKYANQIWMDGEDYGYADVPSISPRDAAITYRDFVLYDDLHVKDLWFPVANMMTHGIIKGTLEKLGGENEPLDKFTNEALLYFARGVSMWELYISPDILSEGEWNAVAQSLAWAKDRFPVLAATAMVGGDPRGRGTYGYVHFKGYQGIVAARNPSIEPGTLDVRLDPSLGIERDADSLVLERVYPSRWISPRLFKAGAVVHLPLDGYETAVYEMYPLRRATLPLVAGVDFESDAPEGKTCRLTCYPQGGAPSSILNPGTVRSMKIDGRVADPRRFSLGGLRATAPVRTKNSAVREGKTWEVSVTIDSAAKNGMLAFLLKPAPGAAPQASSITLDGAVVRPDVQSQKGKWSWYTLGAGPGEHTVLFSLSGDANASCYFICDQSRPAESLTMEVYDSPSPRPMPPAPVPAGTFRITTKLAEAKFSITTHHAP